MLPFNTLFRHFWSTCSGGGWDKRECFEPVLGVTAVVLQSLIHYSGRGGILVGGV